MTPTAPALITLTTDFGTADTYVGVMKGVILGINPHTRIVDLTHAVRPQDLLEATARLEAAISYFPTGTVHLVVVDPGVGTSRAAIVVRTANSAFVAPDNGVLTLPLQVQPPIEAIKLTEAARPYLREPVSATFHGRDVFAPVAAHLASGIALTAFGVRFPPIDLATLPVPSVEYRSTAAGMEINAPVLYSDHFGNLVTALRRDAFGEIVARRGNPGPIEAETACSIGAWYWRGIVATFASVAPGEPLAYWGSSGRLEIGIRNGNAVQSMQVISGDHVTLRWE